MKAVEQTHRRLSGWCGVRGRVPASACAECVRRGLRCECEGCANPQGNKAKRGGVVTLAAVDTWENGASRKDGPAGAPTPVDPGLTPARRG